MAETLAAPCLCPWPEQDAAPRHREGCPSAPAAPLEKAVEESRKALADYDGCKGYEADEYAMSCIEPFRLLLAAIDAIDSRSPCPECAAEMHGPELVPRPAPPADAATEAVNRLSPIATEPVARAAEIVRERLRIYGNTSTYLYDCPGLVAEVTDLLDALAALSSPPRPETKDDDKGGAA